MDNSHQGYVSVNKHFNCECSLLTNLLDLEYVKEGRAMAVRFVTVVIS